MASSGMIRRVALVRTEVSEKLRATIIKVIRIGELGTLAVTSNRRSFLRNVTLMMEALSSSERLRRKPK
jgi:tRNA A37 threonylcarbamoyladenosine dehydratase